MKRGRRRTVPWSLRTTLTVTIAGLFVVATGTVLAVQYGITVRALNRQVESISIGSAGSVGVPEPAGAVADTPALEHAEVCVDAVSGSVACPPGATQAGTPAPEESGTRNQVSTLRDSVLTTTGTSVVVVFLVFTVLALLLAWFVASRTTRRIAAISDEARRLDPRDPGQRIGTAAGPVEIEQLVGTLNHMLDRIERAVVAQRQFVANASHELRTPIAAVQTSLDAPLAQGRFPADVEPAVRRALAANRKSATLVTSLLELAHAQGQVRDGGVPVDLAALVRRALAERQEHAPASDLDVDTTGLAACPALADPALADPALADPALADPVLAGLAVRNLVENALTHNRPGGAVSVSVVPGTTTVTLRVTNTTRAHDRDDDVEALVQPFFRGAGTRTTATPGVGVGLSIVDAVAQAHGGTLRLTRPEPGRFRAELVLPRRPDRTGPHGTAR